MIAGGGDSPLACHLPSRYRQAGNREIQSSTPAPVMIGAHWTDAPARANLPAQPGASHFSDAQWRELLNEDSFALSSVWLLLASIVGMGLLGMMMMVGILAFGG